ncbi:MAG: FkbM family methyltransferase [Candidatus Omnitrophica bacterium]|nr:FkbM family methyltransferase [Candidatus Omnitrophota bacterium]
MLNTIWHLCTFAMRIGVGWRTKWVLASSLVGWRYEERIPFFTCRLAEETPLTLRACGRSCQVFLSTAPGNSDLSVLYEIFGRGVYDLTLLHDPMVIVDLGSYIGLSALYFRLRYPQARLYCVEPDPDNYARLCRNTAHLPNLERFPYAIAGGSGRRELYLSSKQTCGHSLYQAEYHKRSVEVECVTLEGFLQRLGGKAIDILKFDIEGAETEVFSNFRAPLPIGCFIGELHLAPRDEQAFCQPFLNQGYEVALSKETFFGVTLFRALKPSI